MNEKVSIIIPTYGRSNRLKKAIDSVLNQSYSNIEVIIVDDNHSDSIERKNTIDLVQQYNIQNLKLILMSENGGACKARNKGIEKSEGEYISFLDDDDEYEINKIERQMSYLKKYNNYDFVCCGMKIYVEDLKRYKKNLMSNIGDKENFALYGICYTPMLLIKKESLKNVGGFTDTPKFQDHLLILKLLLKGYKGIELNEALYIHNIHSGERVTYSSKYKQAIDILEEYEKKVLFESKNKDKLEKLLKLKRLRWNLASLQIQEKRDKYQEIHLIRNYLKILLKEGTKVERKELIKMLLRLIIPSKKLEIIKVKLCGKKGE